MPMARLDIADLCRLRRSPGPVGLAPTSVVPAPGQPLHVLPVPDLRGEADGERGQAARSRRRSGIACRRSWARRPSIGCWPPRSGATRAGPSRPRGARDALRDRLPGVGGGRPAPDGPRPARRGSARCVGKGDKERIVPLGSGPGRPWPATSRRPAGAGGAPARDADLGLRRPLGTAAVAGRRSGGSSRPTPAPPGCRRRSARTRSGTASRPTSSPAAPTSAPSRRCSGTPRSPPPRSTPAWS